MIVDRIEGSVAVVEVSRGEMRNIPLASISGRVRDGAVLVPSTNGGYTVDEPETARRASHAQSRLNSLFKK